MITQIYAIQHPREAADCVAIGVDHIGSVLMSASEWKQPLVRDVARETQRGGKRNTIIPLFGDLDVILRAVDYYRPDIVHLCDSLLDETGKMLPAEPFLTTQHRLRASFPDVGIMRSIPVRLAYAGHELPTEELARQFQEDSDWLLLDAWVEDEPVEGFIGITGKVIDWDISATVVAQSQVPVILAGGLASDNVADAIRKVRPAGVDSCTRTNAVDDEGRQIMFRKDLRKVAEFVATVQRVSLTL